MQNPKLVTTIIVTCLIVPNANGMLRSLFTRARPLQPVFSSLGLSSSLGLASIRYNSLPCTLPIKCHSLGSSNKFSTTIATQKPVKNYSDPKKQNLITNKATIIEEAAFDALLKLVQQEGDAGALKLEAALSTLPKDKKNNLLNKQTPSGRRLLHVAAEMGNIQCIETLLAHGMDVDTEDGACRTPLQTAAKCNHVNLAKFLIDAGANINHNSLDTPVHSAAEAGSLEVLILLLRRGAQMNQNNSRGQSALHLAAHKRHASCIIQLIGNGEDVDGTDNFGNKARDYYYDNSKDSDELKHRQATFDLLVAKGMSLRKAINNQHKFE